MSVAVLWANEACRRVGAPEGPAHLRGQPSRQHRSGAPQTVQYVFLIATCISSLSEIGLTSAAVNQTLTLCGAVPVGVKTAVLSLWMSSDNKYGFFEMCSADVATVTMGLNGIAYGGSCKRSTTA